MQLVENVAEQEQVAILTRQAQVVGSGEMLTRQEQVAMGTGILMRHQQVLGSGEMLMRQVQIAMNREMQEQVAMGTASGEMLMRQAQVAMGTGSGEMQEQVVMGTGSGEMRQEQVVILTKQKEVAMGMRVVRREVNFRRRHYQGTLLFH